MFIVDDGEIRAISEDIPVMGLQLALFPARKLFLQRMEDPRNGRRTGMGVRQRLDDFTYACCADAFHEHVADTFIQLCLATLIALKQLRMKSAARAWHRQVFYLTHRGDQVAFVISVAVIFSAQCPLVKSSLYEVLHLLF